MVKKMNERFVYHYDKIVKCIKDVINDDEMTSEEKVKLLGVVL